MTEFKGLSQEYFPVVGPAAGCCCHGIALAWGVSIILGNTRSRAAALMDKIASFPRPANNLKHSWPGTLSCKSNENKETLKYEN